MAKSKKPSASAIAKAAAAGAVAAAAAAANEEEIDLEGLEEDETDELIDALEELDDGSSGIVWEVYCSSPFESEGLIKKMRKDELRGLRDFLLSKGPGTYRIVARNQRGRFLKNSSRTFKISTLAETPNASAPARSGGNDPMQWLAEFERRQEKRKADERAERMENIRFWAPLLAPIGLKLAENLFGGREKISDLIQAMVSMKTLQGSENSQLDTLLKGIELAKDMGGDGKGRTWPDVLAEGVRDVATQLAPAAKTLLEHRAANGGAPSQPAAPATFAPAPTSALPQPANGASTVNDPMLKLVEPLLQKLAAELEEFATNGAAPDLAAESLLAKVPRALRSQVDPRQLQGWLNEPEWWTKLVQFRPSLHPYQAYCDDVRMDLLEQVEEMLKPAANDAGEAPSNDETNVA